MKLNKVPLDLATVETEKNEAVLTPSLQLFSISGSKHRSGGTPQILPEGSKIFSEHLKADKDLANNLVGKDKQMSFAGMASMYDTIPELTILQDDKEDELSKKTAQLMLSKKVAQLEGIFEAQELKKEQDSTVGLKNLMSKIEGNGLELPQAKHGGKVGKLNEIPKYQKGVQIPTTYGNLGTNMQNINPYARIRTNPIEIETQMFPNSAMVKQNLFGQKLYNDPRVGEYQRLQIAWDKDRGYLKDPLSLATRRETVSHIFNHADVSDNGANSERWKHIDVFDSKGNPIIKSGKKLTQTLPEGDFTFNMRTNALGEYVPSYVDNDNVEYQVPMYQMSQYDATPDGNIGDPIRNPVEVLNPLKPLAPKEIPIPKPNLPKDLIKPTTPTTNNPNFNSDLLDTYKLAGLRDVLDLATLDVRPPAYNYKPQNIAYQRFLPQNTMSAERQFNLQKERIENSDLPEQVKQAYLSDMYGKLQDNISEVQLRNFQGDLQTDNQNVNLYNQVTDQNRKERIQYDDKFEELNARTLFNRDQEKLRLQDQLINNYGKYNQQKLMMNLVNSMGENYMFDGEKVVYIPGRGNKIQVDPLQQYQESQIQKLLKDLNNAPTAIDKKNIAEAIKALQNK